jgi:PAS domain S-box-containing protein
MSEPVGERHDGRRRATTRTRPFERDYNFRQILENSPDTVMYQDRDLRYRWILHPQPPFTEEAVLGKTDFDLYPEGRAEILSDIKHHVMASGEQARIILSREHEGREAYLETSFVPARDGSGDIVGVIGYGRDVTKRVRAEMERAELQRQIEIERARLATIFAQANNPIIYVDAESGLIRANPAAEALFGHPLLSSDGREQYLPQERYPDGRQVPAADEVSSKALRGEPVAREEYVVHRPDGSKVPIIANSAPIARPAGQILGAVTVVQDISAMKELERLREEWTSVIAHDLRHPVTVIAGYAGLLVRTADLGSPPARAAVDHILTSVHQLDRMIVDLLDLSRIQSRQLRLDRHPVDLLALVSTVVERTVALTRDRHIRVRTIGRVPVTECDPDRIDQVLTNLLVNAVKYGERETPIGVTLDAAADEVIIGVANRGFGIAAEEMPSLFSRFHRTRIAQLSQTSGLGLGLYIARGIVEAHGGRIWAESIPGETTTFRFTLPIGEARGRPD